MIRIYFIMVCVLILAACGGEKHTYVVLTTDLGAVVIDVYEGRAPLSSADFLYYVE